MIFLYSQVMKHKLVWRPKLTKATHLPLENAYDWLLLPEKLKASKKILALVRAVVNNLDRLSL